MKSFAPTIGVIFTIAGPAIVTRFPISGAFCALAPVLKSIRAPMRTLRRGRRRRTMQRLVQFQQRTFVQRDKAGARSIDVRNYCNDDRDESWKNESLKNRVTPGSSRLITDEPQA